MAEHLALETLHRGGLASSKSKIYNTKTQRFLEIVRFDRVGALGRRGVVSLEALDAQFVGRASEPWPVIAQSLQNQNIIGSEQVQQVALLWAFGSLIGNSDMHNGNLSFLIDEGPPFALAPSYDMTPMSFAPTSAGGLPERIHPVSFQSAVGHPVWRQAKALAESYLSLLKRHEFSKEFEPCLLATQAHIEAMGRIIDRLA